MPGSVLREGRCGERCWLIRDPIFAPDAPRPLIRTAPCSDVPAVEQPTDGSDRSHRIESALVVPGADGRVGDGAGEHEEQLDVEIEPVLTLPVVVAARDELPE